MITNTDELLAAFNEGKNVMARQKGGVTWIRLQQPVVNHAVFEYWIGDNFPRDPASVDQRFGSDAAPSWVEESSVLWKLKLPCAGKNVVAMVSRVNEKWMWEHWPWQGQWGTTNNLDEAKKLAACPWLSSCASKYPAT